MHAQSETQKTQRTTPDDSGRLRTIPDDSERLRTTLTTNDSGQLRLRTTPDDSEQLRATPDDSGLFRLQAELLLLLFLLFGVTFYADMPAYTGFRDIIYYHVAG